MVISLKELPNLPRLVHDYYYDYGRVDEFFNGDFRDPSSFRRQAERAASRSLPREPLAAILGEQNQRYGCGPRTLANVQRIVRDRAGVVVTGQQVGLFSGPLYAIYKALTAVKLAERLDRVGPGPCVPVFWLASDDHDLAEIDHIAVVDKDDRLEEIRCEGPYSGAKIPASEILLPEGISESFRRLKDLTRDSEFQSEIIGHLADAYRPGRSFVDAFAAWMTRLFSSSGLIFIDASHPELKALGQEIFRLEIAEESPSTRAVLAKTAGLRRAGYEEQIHLHPGILNVFFFEGERRSIQFSEGAFSAKETGRVWAKRDLLALAAEKPFLFSPNVLLRPIYQDALLPTVAYVGGPGEIAYFAQMRDVYDAFHLPMPVIFPRQTMTILEGKIERILTKYGLEIPDLWRRADEIVSETAKKKIPEPLAEALAGAGTRIRQEFDSIRKEVSAFDPTLGKSADLAQSKLNLQLRFLETKINRASAKKNEIEVRQLRKAVTHLYPNHRLQERVLNLVPFLLRYGYDFMARLNEAVDLDEVDHRIISVGRPDRSGGDHHGT